MNRRLVCLGLFASVFLCGLDACTYLVGASGRCWLWLDLIGVNEKKKERKKPPLAAPSLHNTGMYHYGDVFSTVGIDGDDTHRQE